MSDFSNYGTCTDIAAPGRDILSAYHLSNSATAIMSGTSMATPLVAGVTALVLEQMLVDDNETVPNPATAMATVKSMATQSKVAQPVGSKLPLLFSSVGLEDVPQPPPPPPPPQVPQNNAGPPHSQLGRLSNDHVGGSVTELLATMGAVAVALLLLVN
jgi:subtilisin family serine protease